MDSVKLTEVESETIRELTYCLQELLFDDQHSKVKAKLQKLQDNGTYYNWYHGYSELLLNLKDGYHDLNNDYEVRTTATHITYQFTVIYTYSV